MAKRKLTSRGNWRLSVKVGDLVRVVCGYESDGSTGLIVKIEEFYLMGLKTRCAILHSGESFALSELEVISESR